MEYCFNVETSEPLAPEELLVLKQILTEGFIIEKLSIESLSPKDGEVVELGPRLNFATAYSTNLVAICHSCGLEKVIRIERSRRYFPNPEIDKKTFIRENHDRMTECVYHQPLETFKTGIVPEPFTRFHWRKKDQMLF